jgi:hypothetical protein
MELEGIKLENLVKLTQIELKKISEGRLTFINHPTKGQRRVDTRCAYVNTFGLEMTEDEKKLFK